MKPNTTSGDLRRIQLALIVESRTNPRTDFNPAKLAELQTSIAANLAAGGPGITEPLTVRALSGGKFELVKGARRARCAQKLKMTEVPCIVKALSDAELQEEQWTAFLAEGLSDLEEAATFKRLIELQPGKTLDEKIDALAPKLGKKRSTILGRIALLKLPEPARQALASGEINKSVAEFIAAQPLPAAQKDILAEARRGASFRQLKQFVENTFNIDLSKAPFNIEDPALDCFGPCSKCEFYGANVAAKFPDLKLAPATCTNGEGYAKKLEAHTDKLRAKYEGEGFTVLSDAEAKKLFWAHSPGDNLTHATGYVTGDDTEWDGKAYRTWPAILGKHTPRPTIAIHHGRPIKLFVMKEVRQIAAEHKLIKKRHSHSGSNGDNGKAARAAAQLKEKINDAVVNAAVKRVEEGTIFKDAAKALTFVRLIAGQLTRDAWSDRHREIVKGRGLKDVKPGDLHKMAADMTHSQCHGLIFEIALARGWRGYGYGHDGSGRLKALKMLGVDAKAIERRVRKELKAAQKPLKKSRVESRESKAKPGKPGYFTKTLAARSAQKGKKK